MHIINSNQKQLVKAELSVLSLELERLQKEIDSVLNKVTSLKLEVSGNPEDPENVIGVIHSPARKNQINKSIEMFVGTYYVGDILRGTKSKVGSLIFGEGSECKFHFDPTDPLHGVNRRYIDQIVSPIANELNNMINRHGDCVPVNPSPGAIPECTFIYTGYGDPSSTTYFRPRWFITDETKSIDDDFDDDFSKSRFWLNLQDARYYGSCDDDMSIMNFKTTKQRTISKIRPKADPDIVENAGISFKNSEVSFDATSKPRWEGTPEMNGDGFDLINVKKLKEVQSKFPIGPGAFIQFEKLSLTTTQQFFNFANLDKVEEYGLVSKDKDSKDGYFTFDNGILTCIRTCSVFINTRIYTKYQSRNETEIFSVIKLRIGSKTYEEDARWYARASSSCHVDGGGSLHAEIVKATIIKDGEIISISTDGNVLTNIFFSMFIIPPAPLISYN